MVLASFNIYNDCVYGWISHIRTCEQQADGSEGILNGPQLHDSLVDPHSTALYCRTSWKKSCKLVYREIGVRLLSHDIGLIHCFCQSYLLSWYSVSQP